MSTIKFGIIGFGFMGHIHEEMIAKEIEGAQVVAICDIHEERMMDAVTPGVLKFAKVEDLLLVDEIDTVLIVVPNHLHLSMVKAAAIAGKNIICEKPVAMNREELDEMIRVTEKHGVRFTVHQQRRWDKDYRTMKKVYEEELVGKVYTVQSKLYGINGNMHDWHVYKEFGGGMLYDWGVHLIDQMLDMIGVKVVSVYADLRNVINFEVDDYFKIMLRFENGIVGEIELGTYFLADKEKWFERHWFIGGNKGSAYADGFDPVGKVASTTHLLESVPDKTTMTKSGPTRSFGPPQPGILQTAELPEVTVAHKMFFENYIASLHGEEEMAVKIEEVRRVMQVMDAVRESADKNQVVGLSI